MALLRNGRGQVHRRVLKRKRLLFLATTAKGHKRGKLHPGSLPRTLRRSYRGRSLRRVRGQVIVVRKGKANRNLVFGVRGRRIRYIAVVDRSILRKPSLLIKFHKRGLRHHEEEAQAQAQGLKIRKLREKGGLVSPVRVCQIKTSRRGSANGFPRLSLDYQGRRRRARTAIRARRV